MLPPSNANCLNMLPYQYTLTANAFRMSAQSATTELQIHCNIAQHCQTALALTKLKALQSCATSASENQGSAVCLVRDSLCDPP